MALCFAFMSLQAQDDDSQLSKTWTLGFALIGAEAIAEFPVSQKSTFRLATGAVFSGSAVQVGSNDFEFTGYGVFSGSATYRFYYMTKDINRKNKPLFYNSGNYIFGQLAGSLPTLSTRDDFVLSSSASFGVGWGLQRMYQNKFVFSFSIGPGINLRDPRLTLVGELTLGIRLSPKENN